MFLTEVKLRNNNNNTVKTLATYAPVGDPENVRIACQTT